MVLTFGPLLGKALRLFWESVFGFLAAIFADLRKVALDSLRGKGLKWGYPYSLGILIEWKLGIVMGVYSLSLPSLLARDINWMETRLGRQSLSSYIY